MRFAIVSKGDEGLGLAHHLAMEGHDVVFVSPKVSVGVGFPVTRKSLHGINPREQILELLSWQIDVYVVTHQSLVEISEGLKNGFSKVLGPSVEEPNHIEDVVFTLLFDGMRFWEDVFISKRDMKFLSGNLGQTTKGEAISTWRIAKRDFFPEEIAKLEEQFRKTGYKGMVFLTREGEEMGVSVGFELDILYTIAELSRRELGLIINALLSGEKLHLACGMSACAVKLTLPPYPNGHKIQIPRTWEMDESAFKHIWFQNCQKLEGFDIATADGGCEILWASAYGAFDIDTGDSEARTRVLKTLKGIDILDKQYRNDFCFHRRSALWVVDSFMGGIRKEEGNEKDSVVSGVSSVDEES